MTKRLIPLIVAVILLIIAVLAVALMGKRTPPPVIQPPASSSTGSVAMSAPGPQVSKTTLYFIAPADKAAAFTGVTIGCSDKLVSTQITIQNSTNIIGDAYLVLLREGNRIATAKGLINALSGSTLTPQAVLLNEGVLTLHLSGSLLPGGTCDSPRIIEQLTRVGMQFPGVREVKVYVRGVELSQYLSARQKGAASSSSQTSASARANGAASSIAGARKAE